MNDTKQRIKTLRIQAEQARRWAANSRFDAERFEAQADDADREARELEAAEPGEAYRRELDGKAQRTVTAEDFDLSRPDRFETT